jgi:hypothetical protein
MNKAMKRVHHMQTCGNFTKKVGSLVLDVNYGNAKINLKKHYLFATNIAAIFEENMIAKDLNYLSCDDIDSHDL